MTTYANNLVVILDATDGDLIGDCGGPLADERCSKVGPNMVVPCAGHRIVSGLVADPFQWRLHVPPGSVTCPLGWLAGEAV